VVIGVVCWLVKPGSNTPADFGDVAIGLFGATAIVITRVSAQSGVALGVTVVTAAVTYKTRLNPLWIFAAAALLGLSGAI